MKRMHPIFEKENQVLLREFLFSGIVTIVLTAFYAKSSFVIALLLFTIACILFVGLFFWNRFTRYFFSILFSLGWACGAFMVGLLLDTTSLVPAVGFAFYAFIVAIWGHKDFL